MYPMWAKVWAFQGIVRMGIFDKNKMKFSKRTKDTVAQFIDVNYELLSLAIDYIVKNISGTFEVEDKMLNMLIKSGSFQKLYEELYRQSLNNQNEFNDNEVEGNWVKYLQGSDHMKLVKSLKGKGTGWCTAGELMASRHLSMGDFYVYYTKDEKGKFANPRIAIRMEDSKISEVRGILENQNIEKELYGVLENKLNEFGDKEKKDYIKKSNDMKRLTKLYNNKLQNIDVNDLIFLYELEEEIEGFGIWEDPRIEEIKYKRDITADYAYIIDNSIEKNKYIYKMDIENLKSVRGIKFPASYNRNLIFSNLLSVDEIEVESGFKGAIILNRTTAEGMVFSKDFNCSLELDKLKSVKGLVLPDGYSEFIHFDTLDSLKDLKIPKNCSADISVENLKSAKGFIIPSDYTGCLDLGTKTAKDIVLPKGFSGELFLYNLNTLEGLVLPDGFKGKLSLLGEFKSFKDIVLPSDSVDFEVEIENENIPTEEFINMVRNTNKKMR